MEKNTNKNKKGNEVEVNAEAETEIQTSQTSRAIAALTEEEMERSIALKVAPHLAIQAGLTAPLKKAQVIRYLISTMNTSKNLPDEHKEIVKQIVEFDNANRKPRGRKPKAKA